MTISCSRFRCQDNFSQRYVGNINVVRQLCNVVSPESLEVEYVCHIQHLKALKMAVPVKINPEECFYQPLTKKGRKKIQTAQLNNWHRDLIVQE